MTHAPRATQLRPPGGRPPADRRERPSAAERSDRHAPAAHTPTGGRHLTPASPPLGTGSRGGRPDEHTAQSLAASLLGGWNLVDHTRLVDGQVVGHPLGPGPLGRLEYRPDGRMSALLMRRDRPWPDGLSFTRATDEQRGAAALGFVGYAGRYTLRGDLVLHHVEMSLYVEHVGDVLTRRISWEGPRLVLHTEPRPTRTGGTTTDRLEWSRDPSDRITPRERHRARPTLTVGRAR
ncbi:lipocalin-like domain-containing protein [Streptomyces sp. INA 01156]